MREKWFSFENMAVFDHEQQRFWHRKDIKELATAMWNDAEMGRKPKNDDLAFIFRHEFDAFGDPDNYALMFWDDARTWELVDLPVHIGFGIIEGGDRFKELCKSSEGCS